MNSFNCESLGFPLDAVYVFGHDDQVVYVSPSAQRTVYLVFEILNCWEDNSPYWLLKVRPQIREIIRRRCMGVLSRIVELAPDRRVRLLAIWLVGRCKGTVGTKRLARLIGCSDRQTHKQLAKAFRRMSAWAELRALMKVETDPRIRRLAQHSSQRSFEDCLAELKQVGKNKKLPTPNRKFEILPGVSCSDGKPAKSRTFIRIVLERIHRLVGTR